MQRAHANLLTVSLLAAGAILATSTGVSVAHPHDDEYEPAVFDLKFPGGSPAELQIALRRGEPAANLVIVAPADRLRIPAMDLVSVDVESVLDALDGFEQSIGGVVYQLDISAGHGDADRAVPVYVLTAEIEGHEKNSGAWSLAQYIERGGEPDALLIAVRTGLSFAGVEAEMRYDPGSRLLMAQGSDQAIDLIDEVLDGSIDGLEARDRIHARMVIEEMAVVIESRLRIAELEGEVARLQRQLQEKGR